LPEQAYPGSDVFASRAQSDAGTDVWDGGARKDPTCSTHVAVNRYMLTANLRPPLCSGELMEKPGRDHNRPTSPKLY